jgi:hypothetical protein
MADYAIKIDSINHNAWAPTGVRLGFDIAGPIYNYFEPSVSNYEMVADVDLSKFFLVVGMGKGAYTAKESITDYSNSGFFFRVGADVNMTPRDPKLNDLFFGLRYATSSFSESLNGNVTSENWDDIVVDEEQQKSNANWIEMNLGMRVRLWDNIFTGYTIRCKLFKHNAYNEGKFESYFIPGYGVASNTINWGISYYVQYRIAWKRKPIPWKEN